jgi:hypothetical protein
MVHSIPDLLSERAHVLGSTLFDFSSPDLASNAAGERRPTRKDAEAAAKSLRGGPSAPVALLD